ncbi:enoyl-CoA hydratase/isomerase family protein [Halomicroarcula limicola]|uniref:Enoyl-CoA hydratase/isomerase family protein n=1 Tax=Haloarcula limicola TaxID=1429915 RepID=A0A8J7Y811_9EURY|nr:enoyl-CoA hydratase/isomerase family protein [Halomicroarcula limicola]MBV0925952.1 enoyl-CoA hydratase/isomerase family protein [Halomicroarcula limicola]
MSLTDGETRRYHDTVRADVDTDTGVAWLVMEADENDVNAFTATSVDALTEAVTDLREDVECLVLYGERDFSVGADLIDVQDTPQELRPPKIDNTAAASNRFIQTLRSLDAPVVAAVVGTAAGGGLGFALACDMIAMQESATLDTAYARIGLTPDNATPFFLTRAVGPYQARDLLFDPRPISAAEAKNLGITDRIVGGSNAEFRDEVSELASRLAMGPTDVYGKIKTLVDSSFHSRLDEHLELERDMIRDASESDTFDEGLKAFAEKRDPDWE